MGTKDVYNHAKKGAIDIKTPKALCKIQIKSIFYENFLN